MKLIRGVTEAKMTKTTIVKAVRTIMAKVTTAERSQMKTPQTITTIATIAITRVKLCLVS